jgi:hypothetical protein
MITHHKSEKGQAIVFLAIALIALLGFVAIAVDGGMAYSDRRQAQNGSDASSLAGGGRAALSMENADITYKNFNCSSSTLGTIRGWAKEAAETRALTNGFDVTTNVNDVNGVEVTCDDNGGPGRFKEKYLDITTRISNVTEMHLAQLIFGGELRNNVNAVTRVRPRTSLAFGNAVVALYEGCDGGTGGVNFGGNVKTEFTGGGIYSNGCVTANGNTTIDLEAPFEVVCTNHPGDPPCNSKWNTPSPIPAFPSDYPLPDASYTIPEPTGCGPNRPNPSGDYARIQPGTYTNLRVNNNQTVVMEHGLYCITGNSGLTVNGTGNLSGFGVTIYVYGTNTSVTMNGSGSVNLKAPPARDCAAGHCPPAIPGVLIYLSNDNKGEVTLTGTESSTFEGVIYVPNGAINVSGTSDQDMPINAQLVSKTVNFYGNAKVKLNFDESLTYSFPARVDLFK